MNTSLGFHTMELSLRLTADEASQLIQTFARHKDIYMVSNDEGGISQHSFPSKYYTFRYRQSYKGLSWTLRYCRQSPDYMRPRIPGMPWEEDRCCSVKARINPKILLGLDDYIAAADWTYLKDLIAVFNHEAKKISPSLKDFGSYSVNRIDYCINFDLEDLMIGFYPVDYIALVQQADIPNHFTEYKEYRGSTHRKKPGLNSFYIENNSVRINCYWKYPQLQAEFPSAPCIDSSFNIIRFEIQCLYLKTRFMQQQIKDCDDFEKIISAMLSDEMCEKIITSYYYKTIGKGDYYSLEGAREKVRSMNFNCNREERLLNALKLVSLHHGIAKAKSLQQGKELEELKRSIKELGEIGVNPVTIPRERGIKFLPNLLNAYLAEKERVRKASEEYWHNNRYHSWYLAPMTKVAVEIPVGM